ncbi:MAG: hypothetical protein ACLP5H_00180 [Desulfomonilaceae bacterium]
MAVQTWCEKTRDHGHILIPVAMIEITSEVVAVEPCFSSLQGSARQRNKGGSVSQIAALQYTFGISSLL